MSSMRDDYDEENKVEDLDLSNPEALTKYRLACDIANAALQEVVNACAVGKRVVELCELGDRIVTERVSKIYQRGKVEKGIAFPTCLSINNCMGHFSPLNNDNTTLQEGDVIKIDLGCYIDGYIGVVAHTICLSSSVVTDRRADVIAAAYTASEAVRRIVQIGRKNTEVTPVIQQVAEDFKCQPVEGVLSHQMKRFIIDGDRMIANRASPEQKLEEFEFEANQIYQIDVAVSTGEGKGREIESRTTVFKRILEQNYMLKLQASRYVFGQINTRFPTMPFTLRAFDDEKKARLGIVECVKHELVQPYPVLYEREGEFVAHFKFTALLLPNGTLKATGLPMPENIQSQLSVQNAEVQALLQKSAARKNKRGGKNKKKATGAASDSKAMEVDSTASKATAASSSNSMDTS